MLSSKENILLELCIKCMSIFINKWQHSTHILILIRYQTFEQSPLLFWVCDHFNYTESIIYLLSYAFSHSSSYSAFTSLIQSRLLGVDIFLNSFFTLFNSIFFSFTSSFIQIRFLCLQMANGNQKLFFYYFYLRSSIVLTFSIAAYPVGYFLSLCIFFN